MSSIPPDTAAEVEKLEELHQQHPEGRYFVPLADRYRKLGMVEQAEELLREGLRKHPGYLSAHIVLGGCLADRGVLEEAGDEFRYVLSQDPQNLIALRTLGELAAAGGRGAEAERWYGELLAVDPMNKEARQALDALAGDRSEPEPDQFQDWGTVLLDEPDALSLDAEADHFEVDTFSEVTFGPAGADDEFAGAHPEGADDDLDLGPGELPVQPDMTATTVSEEDDWALLDFGGNELAEDDAPAEESEEEVVTETIADLYAQQGLHERAMGVYRELIRRRGGDAALEAKLAASERAARGEDVGEVGEGDPVDAVDLVTFSHDDSAHFAAAEVESPPYGADTFADSFERGFAGFGVDFEPTEPEDFPGSASAGEAPQSNNGGGTSTAEMHLTAGEPRSEGSVPIREWFADLLDWTPGAPQTAPSAAVDSSAPPAEPLSTDEPWAESQTAPFAARAETVEPLDLVEELESGAGAEATLEPVPSEEEEDLSWLTDILDDGAAPAYDQEAASPTPPSDASRPSEKVGDATAEGAGDEDLASFQAWLQSLKR